MSNGDEQPGPGPTEVFLVSGQLVVSKVGGRSGPEALVSQLVVVADDEVAATRLALAREPSLVILGITSLADYENTAKRIRAVVSGASDEWPLLQASR